MPELNAMTAFLMLNTMTTQDRAAEYVTQFLTNIPEDRRNLRPDEEEGGTVTLTLKELYAAMGAVVEMETELHLLAGRM